MGFCMRCKKVKNKTAKNKEEESQEGEEPVRKLWRPCNPWTLP